MDTKDAWSRFAESMKVLSGRVVAKGDVRDEWSFKVWLTGYLIGHTDGEK